jgi:hypothetical protein
MKKITMIFIAVFLFSIFCFSTSASEESKQEEKLTSSDGAYEYIIKEDGTAKLTKCLFDEETIVTPTEIDGHPITAIGYSMVTKNQNTKNVIVSEGVLVLEDSAFSNWDSIYHTKKIVLPSTLKSIGERSFFCAGITQISIPDGVEEIGDLAFQSCNSLSRIYIPQSVTKFGDMIFLMSKKVKIYSEAGSPAEEYANKNGIPFEVGRFEVEVETKEISVSISSPAPVIDEAVLTEFEKALPVQVNNTMSLENIMIISGICFMMLMTAGVFFYFKLRKE